MGVSEKRATESERTPHQPSPCLSLSLSVSLSLSLSLSRSLYSRSPFRCSCIACSVDTRSLTLLILSLSTLAFDTFMRALRVPILTLAECLLQSKPAFLYFFLLFRVGQFRSSPPTTWTRLLFQKNSERLALTLQKRLQWIFS